MAGNDLRKFLDILVFARTIQYIDNPDEYDAGKTREDANKVTLLMTDPAKAALLIYGDKVFEAAMGFFERSVKNEKV